MSSAEHSRPSSGKDQTSPHPDGSYYKIRIDKQDPDRIRSIQAWDPVWTREHGRVEDQRDIGIRINTQIRMSDPGRLEIRVKPRDPVNTQWQGHTNNGPKKHQNQPGRKNNHPHNQGGWRGKTPDGDEATEEKDTQIRNASEDPGRTLAHRIRSRTPHPEGTGLQNQDGTKIRICYSLLDPDKVEIPMSNSSQDLMQQE